ncbi:MAG: hypothetical protein ACLQVG_13380 [Terriglobia bacterium]
MRQSRVWARGVGRNFFRFCVVLSVALLSASSIAAPQNSSSPDARDGARYQIKTFNERRPARSSGTATGNESIPKTFVDMTPAELARAVPELKRLKPAESQDPLPQILQRVGAAVSAFFDNFADTACTEHLTGMVHPRSQRGLIQFDNRYSYLAVAQAGAAKWTLDEYRTDATGEIVKPNAKGGIVTFGFVALQVNFHPEFQADSRFRYLGRQLTDGEETYVVAFAQRPQVARLPASVWFADRKGVVFLQGVAWIDPVGYRVVRLRTDIQAPEPNVGLQRETTEVVYSEVSFEKSGKTMWLPHAVTVNGQLGDYVFHNLHRYSDYRLFNVQVEQKQAKP